MTNIRRELPGETLEDRVAACAALCDSLTDHAAELEEWIATSHSALRARFQRQLDAAEQTRAQAIADLRGNDAEMQRIKKEFTQRVRDAGAVLREKKLIELEERATSGAADILRSLVTDVESCRDALAASFSESVRKTNDDLSGAYQRIQERIDERRKQHDAAMRAAVDVHAELDRRISRKMTSIFESMAAIEGYILRVGPIVRRRGASDRVSGTQFEVVPGEGEERIAAADRALNALALEGYSACMEIEAIDREFVKRLALKITAGIIALAAAVSAFVCFATHHGS